MNRRSVFLSRAAFAASALAVSVGAGSCTSTEGGKSPEFAPTPIVGPHGGAKFAAPSTPPEDLPGVDTSPLVPREKNEWWRLVSQLYAPCQDQAVSIAQCIKERRACRSCVPAARLIASKVREGATADEAEAAYAVRFGPNVKQIDPADSPSRGPASAAVTIVVWSDFECPHCRLAMPMLDAIVEKFSPNVRLVHKFYPLHQHTRAEPAARAAIAAKNQGKYWEMEHTLFEHQGELNPTDFDKYARDLKLEPTRFTADMKAEQTGRLIERDRADADRAGLTGTPFIVINGREFDLTYFRLQDDLEPWIALDLELKGIDSARAPSAARP